ncbi:hypothetical protein UFOVP999_24 [uncultured Caudovirales phage]|uniref:Uncharacterized protein n=1 Tax=uncultured Caudovirales phage TaxID=2100421 RepID=A0A6J5PZQ3_9CAUD|nr:hypothetical protein UFOVP999_24 [uncultured Caudovirales phage]
MIIESKTELLMLLVALENSSELILQDERAEQWHERIYMSLFNRVKDEYNELNDNDELINLHHEYQEL